MALPAYFLFYLVFSLTFFYAESTSNVIDDIDVISVAPSAAAGSWHASSRRVEALVAGGICAVFFICLLGVCVYLLRRRSGTHVVPVVVHSDSCNQHVKINIDGPGGLGERLRSSSGSSNSESINNSVVSIEDLKEVTKNFSEENILGKGGSGTVYKGELHDGTKIAVKRLDSHKGRVDDELFKSEVEVLTKVRHRHLVALRAYSFNAKERLLAYEYVPQGTLSRFLFDWKKEGLKPLEWAQRVVIALDVARGVEYLHDLAPQSFIHRDLKPSNILLGDDMRAKVADFGVALPTSPDRDEESFVELAVGTTRYLAPEYAGMGSVSKKLDVYSFGVILMELITGRQATDERLEKGVHLMQWLRMQIIDEATFREAVDPALGLDEEADLAGVRTVVDLAYQCCATKPHRRPDMSHVVNVLSSLAERWNQFYHGDPDDYSETTTDLDE